ncbi:cyclase family protein [Streptococcus loxodontisalivarius]|uniref:Kynurenine formamidase n=1 Tax=Streptococcus loxodontisalivarius TaxID=1349415 RepID=A0ABS2PTA9_9STRE|nr:cyclase family protein [Streptococcus loxodontisalivarius]MBM7643276.1 kynurenine formamidase [Streptococcus loxodontisalivarius]
MADLKTIYQTLKAAKWVDLTHQIDENSPHFPALPALEKKQLFSLDDGFLVQQFSVVGQYGTHIDAPIHFVEGGRWLDEIALKDLLLPLYVVDLSQKVAENPDYQISKEDLLAFEEEHGQIEADSFVAFRSDWHKRWPSQDAIRNLDENGVQHTPGWSHEALQFLIEERQVKAVGHETLDTDSGVTAAANGGALLEEYYLLEQDRFQLEVLANLDQVPATGSLISIAFPHWEKASGSPVRAIAILPE